MAKTRYLQLTDTTMFEYKMLGMDNETITNRNIELPNQFIYTKLKDGHYAILSPVSCECEHLSGVGYKKKRNPDTLNTINHFTVPEDKQMSEWYNFLDPDYYYVDSSILTDLDPNQVKVKEYSEYLSSPTEGDGVFVSYDDISGIRWDSLRFYFVNGYDFSNIYGMFIRIFVDAYNEDGNDKNVDLCNFFFNRDNAYMLINYLSSPILLGNDVYDRYIEVNLPCLYDLINLEDENGPSRDFVNELNIKNGTNIRLMFSVILENDISISPIIKKMSSIIDGGDEEKEYVNLSYTRSLSVKGTVPTENVNSDNLGCYIAEVPNKPYIKFYATWRDRPLDSSTVWKFNKGIILYDASFVRNNSPYEVNEDYNVEHDERKWMVMHELKLSFCSGSNIIREETYNMNQIFISENDPNIFYYRPMIFDDNDFDKLSIDNIQVVYTMRFVNSNDMVQFVKVASLSLTGNMGKYYSMGTNLTTSDMIPYKIFNKIVENKQSLPENYGGVQSTKYVKVFYDTTNVTLTDSGGNTFGGPYRYTLEMSQAPKTYKFVFRNQTIDGKSAYMDLTNGYYKLMFKDSSNSTVLIEPTYSENMNMFFGELEFNISTGTIGKLMEVNEEDRKMSVVAYNEDGSVSSMFDFLYMI